MMRLVSCFVLHKIVLGVLSQRRRDTGLELGDGDAGNGQGSG